MTPLSRRAPWLLALAVANVVVLTAVRLVTDADDFNNWDLISFVNANAFGSLAELLERGEVHFTNPFRFPTYNTGAESVLSILIHRAMSDVSLYWSNTAVVAVYDVLLLAGLGALFRLVYRDAFGQAAAWMLVGMSTAFLTFLAVSAFNVQAYATIVAGLVASELLLHSRMRTGIALMAVAFLFISQAYPLTFFLPLFCLVWTAARVMMAWGHGAADGRRSMRGAAVVVLAVVVCVSVVEAGSSGRYLEKSFGVVAARPDSNPESSSRLPGRIAALFEEAFWPNGPDEGRQRGFAPYFLWLALALATAASPFGRNRERPLDLPARGDTAGEEATCATLFPSRLRPWLAPLAWAGLVVFGYLPALFGAWLKSQRCVFGDLFLAMATAQAVVWLVRNGVSPRVVVAGLVALLAASDIVYAHAFLTQDHRVVHSPVFDFDPADGRVRHDVDAVLDRMDRQARRENAALLVYYPSGYNENLTDPAMFYARFLRRIGRWQRAHWIFPCRFCEVRYGCPFPDVARRPCRNQCCYVDPVRTIDASPTLGDRRMYVWWYEDSHLDSTARRDRVLARLRSLYHRKELDSPADRWRVYRLDPRRRDRGN